MYDWKYAFNFSGIVHKKILNSGYLWGVRLKRRENRTYYLILFFLDEDLYIFVMIITYLPLPSRPSFFFPSLSPLSLLFSYNFRLTKNFIFFILIGG